MVLRIRSKYIIFQQESQGFKKTDDARLLYNFDRGTCNSDKENIDVNPIPKPKRRFEVALEEPEKRERKEISNLFANSKYQNNIFIQNSRKEEVSNSEPDPSLLSVAERRKLFERRMRGEIDEKTIELPPAISVSDDKVVSERKNSASTDFHSEENDDLEEFNSGNEYSTCESDGKFLFFESNLKKLSVIYICENAALQIMLEVVQIEVTPLRATKTFILDRTTNSILRK